MIHTAFNDNGGINFRGGHIRITEGVKLSHEDVSCGPFDKELTDARLRGVFLHSSLFFIKKKLVVVVESRCNDRSGAVGIKIQRTVALTNGKTDTKINNSKRDHRKRRGCVIVSQTK